MLWKYDPGLPALRQGMQRNRDRKTTALSRPLDTAHPAWCESPLCAPVGCGTLSSLSVVNRLKCPFHQVRKISSLLANKQPEVRVLREVQACGPDRAGLRNVNNFTDPTTFATATISSEIAEEPIQTLRFKSSRRHPCGWSARICGLAPVRQEPRKGEVFYEWIDLHGSRQYAACLARLAPRR
jgi:hypothetical protein